jgi:hypothetical protein
MNLLKKLLLVTATTGLMGSVHAQVSNTDLGTLTPTVQQETNFYASGGAFADIYNFTIAAGTHTLGSSAVSYSPTGAGYVSDLSLTVYSGADGTGSALATVSSSNGGLIDLWRDLAAGTFSIKVSGIADAQLGGGYNFSIAAMPEPAEWMMLLAGLVVVAFMAHRKTRLITA